MDRSLPLSSALEDLLTRQKRSIQSLSEQLGQAQEFERLLQEAIDEMQQEFERRIALKQAELRAQGMLQADQVRARTRREASEVLSRLARQMDEAENSGEWKAALLDAVKHQCSAVVLWSIRGGKAVYEGHRADEPESAGRWKEIEIPLDEAAAFSAACTSMEPIVCLACERELSQPIHAALHPSESQRVYLLPILTGRAQGQRRTAAVLLIETRHTEPLETGWLEAVAVLAGALQECRLLAGGMATGKPDTLGIAPAPVPVSASPASELQAKPEDWEIHQRAQRFARVKVAEVRLYQSQQVIEGRSRKALYTSVRESLDKAREEYAQQFLSSPGLPDYLHSEVIQTLANGDAGLLGADYPGPLV